MGVVQVQPSVWWACGGAAGEGLAAAVTLAGVSTAMCLSPPWCNIYPGSGINANSPYF